MNFKITSITVLLLLSCAVGLQLHAQGSAGSKGVVEPRFLVDAPTAGMVHKGEYALDLDFYQEGGVLFGFTAAPFDWMSLGVSYGGTHLLGSASPDMNDVPGVNLKIRVVQENVILPAIAVGFDTQGKDGYVDSLSRYTIKSPGLYAAASKNYDLLGYFSIHGGINYSFERADEDKDFNIFAGVEKTIGPSVSMVLEYNLAANDSHGRALGKGRGYLNAGVKWSVGGGLTLGFTMKDLTKNGQTVNIGYRTFMLEYSRSF